MQISQRSWTPYGAWMPGPPKCSGEPPHLVLVFGSRSALADPAPLAQLSGEYPTTAIIGCSTAGEILDTHVGDGTLIATEVRFKSTAVRLASVPLAQVASSEDAGQRLGAELAGDGLRHVLVFSDGLTVNGSSLLRGMKSTLASHVQVTGGLAGDGELFEATLTCVGGQALPGMVAAVAFYGAALNVGYGSLGGWDPFGPERIVTRSEGNVLIELDGKNALELYKLYLGEYAEQLPASALLFPLSLRLPGGDRVVRTVLAVNEEAGTMTLRATSRRGTTLAT